MNNKQVQNNIETKILEQIQNQSIKPKSKWEFSLINISFWVMGILTVLLGAMTFSASSYFVKNIRWDLYKATHPNFLTFLLEFTPYLWIGLFIFFIIFTYYFFNKTSRGYKYDLKLVAGIIFGLSIILGQVASGLGLGQLIDDKIGSKIPFHRGIRIHNYQIWNNPEQGLLMGEIQFDGAQYILIDNNNDKHLLITTNGLDPLSWDLLRNGGSVRLVGNQVKSGFDVCLILPEIGNGMQNKNNPNLDERKSRINRSIECEGVKPFRRLLD